MPEWIGYWLDDKTFLAPAADKDGTIYWCKFTIFAPRNKDGSITYDHLTGKYFEMEIIDSNNFEWHGMKYKLDLNKELELKYEMEW